MVLPGKPRGSPTLKAAGGVTDSGRGGASRGGVDDRGALEEDGPVTWEAPVCPRATGRAGRRGRRARRGEGPIRLGRPGPPVGAPFPVPSQDTLSEVRPLSPGRRWSRLQF